MATSKRRKLKGMVVNGLRFSLVVAVFLTGVELLLGTTSDAKAAQDAPLKLSPVKALPIQDTYFPGTENLAPDEMRVTACRTGMPNARPKQAAACWIDERSSRTTIPE